jgi:hypothetical protein
LDQLDLETFLLFTQTKKKKNEIIKNYMGPLHPPILCHLIMPLSVCIAYARLSAKLINCFAAIWNKCG